MTVERRKNTPAFGFMPLALDSFPTEERLKSLARVARLEPGLAGILFAVEAFAPRHADAFMQ